MIDDNVDYEVDYYSYQNKIVYTKTPINIPDAHITLHEYKTDKYLGAVSGGILGQGDMSHPNFYEEAKKIEDPSLSTLNKINNKILRFFGLL